MDADRISFGVRRGGTGSKPSLMSQQRIALIDWIQENFQTEMNEGRVFVATLLFMEGISRDTAAQSYAHFKRSLDRKLYGKAPERHSERPPVKHLGVIEGGGSTGKEVHYHSIFVKPKDRELTDEAFIALIQTQWNRLDKAMKNREITSKIELAQDLTGWIEYQTKFTSKDLGNGLSYLDLLDLNTLKLEGL